MKPAFRKALLLALPLAALTACVKNSPEIGKDLIDKTLLFDTYTVEFPIEEIQLRRANDLSGFSDTRLAIGAIRDDTFGLTTRSTAFGLVPALDTLDLGTDPKFVRFTVRFAADTVSTATPGQEHIFQNFFVYSLKDTLSSKESGTNRDIPHGTEIVSRGIPVYDGKDDLYFELNEAFGQRYIDALKKYGPVLASRDEDNKINMEIANMILKQAGFTVETAENGKIALDMVKASEAGYYDAILMDIQMPEMDGYEATRAIRALDDKALADIPILAMTANAFKEDEDASMEAGMQAHIAKPIDVTVLMKVLAEILK